MSRSGAPPGLSPTTGSRPRKPTNHADTFKLPGRPERRMIPIYLSAILIYRKDFRDHADPAAEQPEDIVMKKETITLGEDEL